MGRTRADLQPGVISIVVSATRCLLLLNFRAISRVALSVPRSQIISNSKSGSSKEVSWQEQEKIAAHTEKSKGYAIPLTAGTGAWLLAALSSAEGVSDRPSPPNATAKGCRSELADAWLVRAPAELGD